MPTLDSEPPNYSKSTNCWRLKPNVEHFRAMSYYYSALTTLVLAYCYSKLQLVEDVAAVLVAAAVVVVGAVVLELDARAGPNKLCSRR